ncbi:hypothetical protein LEP1GSC039_3224 [Leptospira santarosai str. 2000027870]|uniref:hypothetical protein n=1 Tax=Leptospira santarosai TaxID=28183 RepID=UPI0002BD60B4|nr:hypothetical protein [Leptospira santarosai]EMM88456.1 hypothetical protein LEP1GSC039_3224 [Leptospira santarosai str. 2000027870]
MRNRSKNRKGLQADSVLFFPTLHLPFDPDLSISSAQLFRKAGKLFSAFRILFSSLYNILLLSTSRFSGKRSSSSKFRQKTKANFFICKRRYNSPRIPRQNGIEFFSSFAVESSFGTYSSSKRHNFFIFA